MITIKFQKKFYNETKFFYSIIIVSNFRKPKSGAFIEKLGYYHPSSSKWSQRLIFIDFSRLSFWIIRGVQLNKSLYLIIKPINSIFLSYKNYV